MRTMARLKDALSRLCRWAGVHVLFSGIALVVVAGTAQAQRADRHSLASVLEEARAGNAEIQAARRMVEAASRRIPQAGSLPDPVLSAGLMNVPARRFDLRADEMTMATLQLGQRIPAPGTRRARTAMALQSRDAAEWYARETELNVLTRLKAAYYEIHFLDEALEVLRRNRALLVDVAQVARGRLAVGQAPQQDVLRAQTEITRMDEQASGIHARREAALAEANAILQRSPSAPLPTAFPAEVRVLASAVPPAGAFTAAALDGAFAHGFPTLAELQERAIRERPMLREHESRIAESQAALRLAQRERLPEIDVMLGYGVRWGMPDMVSVGVAVPLPIFAARKQRMAVAEAEHELSAMELGHRQMVAEIRADVTARYAELVRTREQIVLLSQGVIPQARATIESAAAAYRAGRVEFLSLLDAQSALFRTEIELSRQLSYFGRAIAELERAAGIELISPPQRGDSSVTNDNRGVLQ